MRATDRQTRQHPHPILLYWHCTTQHICTCSREGELHAAAHVRVGPSPPLEPACCWGVFLRHLLKPHQDGAFLSLRFTPRELEHPLNRRTYPLVSRIRAAV